MCGVYGAETRRKRAHALFAVHLKIENMNDQRIARFCAFNEERAGERIVTL